MITEISHHATSPFRDMACLRHAISGKGLSRERVWDNKFKAKTAAVLKNALKKGDPGLVELPTGGQKIRSERMWNDWEADLSAVTGRWLCCVFGSKVSHVEGKR